ncbi:MAG: vanadium-dependent haloperoxidase [Polyangiaceae bacterium]
MRAELGRCSVVVAVLVAALSACGGDDAPFVGLTAPPADAGPSSALAVVASAEPSALLSVAGTSERDIWLVGADKGRGPSVVRFDGARYTRLATAHRGDLWWVHALADGSAYLAGAEGAVLRYADGAFARLATPGLGKDTVFGVWASSAGDVWAVGAAAGRDGFVWHMPRGGSFARVVLPSNVSLRPDGELPALLKVWGDDKGAVWVVGDRGVVLRGGAGRAFEVVPSGTTERLFAVTGVGDKVVAVGGTGTGVILEISPSLEVRSVAPPSTPLLQGVSGGAAGDAFAVGERGTILRRVGDGAWLPIPNDTGLRLESLHSVYRDPRGTMWAVGGNVLSPRLDAGAVVAYGAMPPGMPPEVLPPEGPASCPAEGIDPSPGGSMARRWNEQALGAIRRDIPNPGVHARNLFHLSAAAWDAWAAHDPRATGFLFKDKVPSDPAERDRAIAVASYRILKHRYARSAGGATSVACFDAFMAKLGLDPENASRDGVGGVALGNRIGEAYVTRFADDGANEAKGYGDTTGYRVENEPLVVDDTSPSAMKLGRWQPLNLSLAATQNGIVLPGGVQGYLGAHWGLVTPFALERAAPNAVYEDPGPGPTDDPAELRPLAVEIVRRESFLDPEQPDLVDVSPASLGKNSLGADDGAGYTRNPVTLAPYASQRVKRADFGRVLAEYWADGPRSETPPGHWNVIANKVADGSSFERKLFGNGDRMAALDWDVHAYLALNGALHDAAIAAWEIKRRDASARPITLIRVMGRYGQSSDSSLPSYHPSGLPLVPGLIELVTSESVASGRHVGFERHLGKVVVRGWRGEPGDRVRGVGGVTWIRAVEWLPYQRRTFVTPAFPGYVSGHSTFSRAAAEVLAAVTGSPYFPGGYEYFEAKPGYLTFEYGPSAPVRLEWASFFDAADQAGQSRLWGGIHVTPDDLRGRILGSRVGLRALAKARSFFAP